MLPTFTACTFTQDDNVTPARWKPLCHVTGVIQIQHVTLLVLSLHLYAQNTGLVQYDYHHYHLRQPVLVAHQSMTESLIRTLLHMKLQVLYWSQSSQNECCSLCLFILNDKHNNKRQQWQTLIKYIELVLTKRIKWWPTYIFGVNTVDAWTPYNCRNKPYPFTNVYLMDPIL